MQHTEARTRLVVRIVALFSILVSGAAPSAEQSAAINTAGIPGETLTGKLIQLPPRSGPAVLLVAFSRAAGEQAADWRQALSAADSQLAAHSLHDVIVLAGAPGFIRGLIIRGIKRGVERALHNQVVVVKDNATAREWRRFASVGNAPDDDGLLILRLQDGAVCARTQGALTTARLAAIAQASCGR